VSVAKLKKTAPVSERIRRRRDSITVSVDAEAHLESLVSEQETALVKILDRYAGVVEAAALRLEPHQLTNYLRELANAFHTFYNGHRLLVEEAPLRNARLTLARASRQVLANGLQLLGVSAPETM